MNLADLLSTLAALVSALALNGGPGDGLAERCGEAADGRPSAACVCLVRDVRSAPMPEPAVLALAGLALLGAGAVALRRRQ